MVRCLWIIECTNSRILDLFVTCQVNLEWGKLISFEAIHSTRQTCYRYLCWYYYIVFAQMFCIFKFLGVHSAWINSQRIALFLKTVFLEPNFCTELNILYEKLPFLLDILLFDQFNLSWLWRARLLGDLLIYYGTVY